VTTQGSKVLVANLGSTSFKFRLFDIPSEQQLARGAVDRIGSPESTCVSEIGDARQEITSHVADHGVALRMCLEQLTDAQRGCLDDTSEVMAIGFKAVHGGRYSGVQRVVDDVLVGMEEMSSIAPAHNPPYIRAMRQLAEQFPEIPLVAAFETGFHATIPERLRNYAIPKRWADEFLVRRWGFHGASHRYIAQRTPQLIGRDDLRIVSCHLGGSSSLCAIRNGKSVATTMGMSPQSGLPQNNRVGDFDVFALPWLMQQTGLDLNQLLEQLATRGGLLGLSGVSGDIRDLEEAAEQGNADAQLALDLFTTEVRRHLGGLLVELGGADVIVFTGGIGENGIAIRTVVCDGLAELGIELDATANAAAEGECEVGAAGSRTRVWVIPTNEELIVARQAFDLIRG
jgi:acetate kinase